MVLWNILLQLGHRCGIGAAICWLLRRPLLLLLLAQLVGGGDARCCRQVLWLVEAGAGAGRRRKHGSLGGSGLPAAPRVDWFEVPGRQDDGPASATATAAASPAPLLSL